MGVGLLREGEGDVIEAALGLIVDTYGPTAIASEGDAAQRLCLGHDRDDWRSDDDIGGRLGGLAEIVHNIAGDGDGARTQASGGEDGGGTVAGDRALGCRVGIGERPILRAAAYSADGNICAGDGGAGVRAAGKGGRLKRLDGEGRSAGGLLASSRAFLDVSGDGIFAGGEACGIDGGFRAGGGDLATIGGPGIDGSLLWIEVQGVGFDLDGIAGIDAGGLRATAEHDGPGWLHVAQAEDEAGREFHVAEIAEATLGAGG